MIDPKERFTDRVADYVKYRPGYPSELYDLLVRAHGLMPAHVVADLGSGTGLLTRLFLERGHRVYGVEPNEAMLGAAAIELSAFDRYEPVRASAEDTTLPEASVDLVTAGQAFHWFDAERTRIECRRILRPDGWVALVWNTWHQATSPFMKGYASIVEQFMPDRPEHSGPEQLLKVARFFGDAFKTHSLPNAQRFDRQGLRGRLLSASYAPKPGHPQHAPMIEALDRLFDAHHDANGLVEFELRTNVFVGRPAA